MRYLTLLFFVFLVCSCAGDEKPSSDGIVFQDAWVKEPFGPHGAAFGTIKNSGKQMDVLLRAESPAARAVEFHKTRHKDDMVHMVPQKQLEIPAGGSVQFAPGNLHFMLIDLKRPLKAGEEIEVKLYFQNQGMLLTSLPVKGE